MKHGHGAINESFGWRRPSDQPGGQPASETCSSSSGQGSCVACRSACLVRRRFAGDGKGARDLLLLLSAGEAKLK